MCVDQCIAIISLEIEIDTKEIKIDMLDTWRWALGTTLVFLIEEPWQKMLYRGQKTTKSCWPCKALVRLASGASICVHSHHEGPEGSVMRGIPAAL